MTPTTWAEVGSLMLVGLGAALFLGTAAAYVQYRRTGQVPGRPAGSAPQQHRATGVAVRCAAGLVFVLLGIAGLVLR